MSDAQHYRTKDEVQEYKDIDPINKVKDVILKRSMQVKNKLRKSI